MAENRKNRSIKGLMMAPRRLDKKALLLCVLAAVCGAQAAECPRVVFPANPNYPPFQQRTAELREASTTDPLTGLRNRRYLDARVASDLQLCLRHYTELRRHGSDDEADLLVMLMDLDHFKRINDRHGHTAATMC